jgi:hypothetical protein
MINEQQNNYNELIFLHCDGDPSKMNELKRFDIFDFFTFIENNEKKIKNARR